MSSQSLVSERPLSKARDTTLASVHAGQRDAGDHVQHPRCGYRVLQHLRRGARDRRSLAIGGRELSSPGCTRMIFGGNITIYSQLCEQAREEAFRIMVDHARALERERQSSPCGTTRPRSGPGRDRGPRGYGTAVRVDPMRQRYAPPLTLSHARRRSAANRPKPRSATSIAYDDDVPRARSPGDQIRGVLRVSERARAPRAAMSCARPRREASSSKMSSSGARRRPSTPARSDRPRLRRAAFELPRADGSRRAPAQRAKPARGVQREVCAPRPRRRRPAQRRAPAASASPRPGTGARASRRPSVSRAPRLARRDEPREPRRAPATRRSRARHLACGDKLGHRRRRERAPDVVGDLDVRRPLRRRAHA